MDTQSTDTTGNDVAKLENLPAWRNAYLRLREDFTEHSAPLFFFQNSGGTFLIFGDDVVTFNDCLAFCNKGGVDDLVSALPIRIDKVDGTPYAFITYDSIATAIATAAWHSYTIIDTSYGPGQAEVDRIVHPSHKTLPAAYATLLQTGRWSLPQDFQAPPLAAGDKPHIVAPKDVSPRTIMSIVAKFAKSSMYNYVIAEEDTLIASDGRTLFTAPCRGFEPKLYPVGDSKPPATPYNWRKFLPKRKDEVLLGSVSNGDWFHSSCAFAASLAKKSRVVDVACSLDCNGFKGLYNPVFLLDNLDALFRLNAKRVDIYIYKSASWQSGVLYFVAKTPLGTAQSLLMNLRGSKAIVNLALCQTNI